MKMIELTQSSGIKIFVNTQHIMLIIEASSGAEVVMIDNSVVLVKEKPIEVVSLM